MINKKFFPKIHITRHILLMFLFLISSLTSCGCPGADKSIDYTNHPDEVIWIYPESERKAGEEVVLTGRNIANYDNIKNAATFEWDYGDGCISPADGMTVSHIYDLPGNYTITLRIKTYSGDVETSSTDTTRTITVSGRPLTSLPPLMATDPLFELNFNNSNMDFKAGSADSISVEMINNCTAVAEGRSDFIDGILGKSFNLSNGKYIRINNIHTLLNGLNSFTISFWIKKSSSGSLDQLVPTAASSLILYHPGFEIGAGGEDYSINARVTTNSATAYINSYHSVYKDYRWQHVAITYDGTYLRHYVDGLEYNFSAEGMDSATETRLPKALNGILALTDSPLLIGTKDNSTTYTPANRTAKFNGYFDELKIFDRCLTREQLFTGFELWHAEIHARTSQYIYVKVPEQFTAVPSNKLTAYISDGARYKKNITLNNSNDVITLIGDNSIASTKQILLNNYLLPELASSCKYTLTVMIVNSQNKVLATKQVSFVKPYAGSPAGGIDENNTIRIGNNSAKGDAFFPVTCWGLTDQDTWEPGKQLRAWTSHGSDPSYNFSGPGQKWEIPVINTAFGSGFDPNTTQELYGTWLNDCTSNGIKGIGPSSAWNGLASRSQNSDIFELIDYVVQNKDYPGQLMWSWRDEPDLNGVPVETIRAWTKLSHIFDPQHPVAVTLRGGSFIPDSVPFMTTVKGYSAAYNAVRFGKITEPLNGIFAADVLGYDYYPIDLAAPHPFDASITDTVAMLENSGKWSRDMIPIYDCIETTDIGDGAALTDFFPSPEQLKMLTWLHVIHGMKQITWFHYFNVTPDVNFRFMGEFVRDMNYFRDILACPDSSRTVTVTMDTTGVSPWSPGTLYTSGDRVANNGMVYLCRANHTATAANQPADEFSVMSWKTYWKIEKRVDVMLKEYNNHLYIFAVRLTEIAPTTMTYTPASGDPFIVADSIGSAENVTIKVSGISSNAYNVYEEDRDGTTTADGDIIDSFTTNDVHIYAITL